MLVIQTWKANFQDRLTSYNEGHEVWFLKTEINPKDKIFKDGFVTYSNQSRFAIFKVREELK